MKALLKTMVLVALFLTLCRVIPVTAQYAGWKHSATLTILTSPEGADLPVSAVVEQFPLLVRLHRDWFDFSQTKPGGEDVRFSSASGEALTFEIDEWDAAQGMASIWVRMPVIRGNERQALRVHWGNPVARNESNGQAVFNDSNGYRSVWHLGHVVADTVGTLSSKDNGTTLTAGMVGLGRHFAGGQGVFGGDKITNYPSAGAAHTTEAWFRAEQPNVTLVGWGNEGGGRGSKVRMQLRSPPHLRIDSDFSDVKGQSRLAMGEWNHVVHTYGDGPRRIYINGLLDGEATTKLDIKSSAHLWLGGWYDHYDFIGDLDEVRVSAVARSATCVRLEYENQKPLQTLVGPLVTPGSAFSVSPSRATVPEGTSLKFMAPADGAQKMYWSVVREGRDVVLAADSRSFRLDAWQVTGD